MFRKPLTLILVILMFSPIITMTHETSIASTQDTPLESTAVVADLDPGRVVWKDNLVPNNGLEEWSNPHSPAGFGTDRTEEKKSWYETSVVSEGSYSFGMHAKAVDADHFSEIVTNRNTQTSWLNPVNVTLDADWYLDTIGNPTDTDYFRLQIEMNNKYMLYYFGCETTVYSNSSGYGYFMIDGAVQTWNHLQRNLTSDYFDVFGSQPTQYETMYWQIRSYTNAYTRAYVDDIWLVNDTITKIGGPTENGDFEGGSGWKITTAEGIGDIAQCSDSHGGLSSMNMTALTQVDNAFAYTNYYPEKLLSVDNKENLSFWWNLTDYINPGPSTYARVAVNVRNVTFQSTMYYYLFVGGTGMLPLIIIGNDMKFAVDGFNVTDTWNFFNRNILDDFTTVYPTESLWVEEIEFQVRNYDDNARISVLIDDVTFTTSILNDMDYEHQNAVGEPIMGWDNPESAADEFTVTDFSASGTKAANLTLTNDYYFSEGQNIDLSIDSSTEIILDFNVYIDTFNISSEDYIIVLLDFNDESLAYVIANSTSEFENEIGEEGDYILLQSTLVTGEWMNFQLDIVHDYEQVFGILPNGILYDIDLKAESGMSSKLSVIFDDLYIYYDSAPEIVSVTQTPAVVDEAGEHLEITAEVVDASELDVIVSYRVDSGDWINKTMDEISSGNYSVVGPAIWGVVEYFIIATDAFGKTDIAMDGGSYFTFTTADTINPDITFTPANGSTVSGIVPINISIQDSGSGIAYSELYIEGALVENVTLDQFERSWITNVLSNGVYNITVVAWDNAGNSDSVAHFVTVDNTSPTPTDTTTDTINPPPGDSSGLILLVVVIAIVGVVIVLYIFVLKKK